MTVLTKTGASLSFSLLFFHFNLFLKKVSISLGELCLKLTNCVAIKYSFNVVIWLSVHPLNVYVIQHFKQIFMLLFQVIVCIFYEVYLKCFIA